MKPRWTLLLPAALVICLALAACGGGPASRPGPENAHPQSAERPPVVEPGPWLTVDEAEDRRLEGRPIYHQGPREPPATLHRGPVLLPFAADEVPDLPLLVQVVLSETGRVARARVLRAPATPGVGRDVVQERLVEALRGFRFTPSTIDNQPGGHLLQPLHQDRGRAVGRSVLTRKAVERQAERGLLSPVATPCFLAIPAEVDRSTFIC